MKICTYVLSQDISFLNALKQINLGFVSFEIGSLQIGDKGCLESTPPVNAKEIIIIDATSKCDLEAVIHQLTDIGWKNVIVVAADPSANEALLVFRDNPTFDYWEKTYVVSKIELKLGNYFHEMDQDHV